MRSWLERHFITLIFGVIGLIFMLVGGGLLWASMNSRRQADTYAARPLLTVAEAHTAPSGQPAIVEGRISEINPAPFEGLAAWQARKYQGQKCDRANDNSLTCRDIWEDTDRVTPPLWLEVADGRLRISNTSYTLLSPPVKWWSTGGRLVAGQTIEYRGFQIGSPVFAGGMIDPAEGGSLRAEFLFGGNQQDYVAAQQNQSLTLLFIGVIFGGLGTLFAAIGGGAALLRR
jgi:hypothetical protein